MKIQNVLNILRESGLTDNDIGKLVDIPQSTIFRLRTGIHKETNYSRHTAIANLEKKIRQAKTH